MFSVITAVVQQPPELLAFIEQRHLADIWRENLGCEWAAVVHVAAVTQWTNKCDCERSENTAILTMHWWALEVENELNACYSLQL